VVTGASTGIGYELAKCCAENGFDLVIAADEPKIQQAVETFRATGVNVEAVDADLATADVGDARLIACRSISWEDDRGLAAVMLCSIRRFRRPRVRCWQSHISACSFPASIRARNGRVI